MHIEGLYLFDSSKVELDTIGGVLRPFVSGGADIEYLTAERKLAPDAYPRHPRIAPLYQHRGYFFRIDFFSFVEGTGECFKVFRRRNRR